MTLQLQVTMINKAINYVIVTSYWLICISLLIDRSDCQYAYRVTEPPYVLIYYIGIYNYYIRYIIIYNIYIYIMYQFL